MPILTWIGKDKVVNHDKELPFRVLKKNKKLSVGDNSENLLIEGDNLEALKALMPFYYGKVKLIYIDPPYNTGSEEWIFNDKVNSPQIKEWINKTVGKKGDDLCRHDKWLCMMYPRLKLLKDLMRDDGVIFASIGEDELSNLRSLMDEIFYETNFVSLITRVAKTASNKGRYFAPSVDYILCYAKDISLLEEFSAEVDESLYKKIESKGPRKGQKFRDDIALYQSSLDTRPNQRYYIECPDGSLVIPPGDTFPPAKEDASAATPKKGDKVWRWSYESYKKNKELLVYKRTKNSPLLDENREQAKWNIYTKSYLVDRKEKGTKPRNYLDQFINRKSADFLKTIDVKFNYAKPVELIKYLISIVDTKNGDIILDSFSGSGTTAQAVLEANKRDGIDRPFILVEMEKDIARNVSAKRLKTIVKGHPAANYPEGIESGFQFLELNGLLYDYSGYVNPDAHYEDMAAYVYFTETKNYLDLSKIENPYIGTQGSVHYYLFFEGKGKNVLDEKTLKKTDSKKGNRVIYADKCLLDDDYLEKHGITFKQIPYELKKY